MSSFNIVVDMSDVGGRQVFYHHSDGQAYLMRVLNVWRPSGKQNQLPLLRLGFLGVGGGAHLQATVDGGGVTAVVVDDVGMGYTSPVVLFSGGGGGTGAVAVAVLGEGGVIESVGVTDAGSGYTSEPTVVVEDGGAVNKGKPSGLESVLDYVPHKTSVVSSNPAAGEDVVGGYWTFLRSGVDVPSPNGV